MKEFVVTTLGFLVVLCFGAQWIASQTKSQLLSALNPDFRKFQKVFFAPYLFALFADWLQGPYVYRQVIHTLEKHHLNCLFNICIFVYYRLYSSYGYAPKEIALL